MGETPQPGGAPDDGRKALSPSTQGQPGQPKLQLLPALQKKTLAENSAPCSKCGVPLVTIVKAKQTPLSLKRLARRHSMLTLREGEDPM